MHTCTIRKYVSQWRSCGVRNGGMKATPENHLSRVCVWARRLREGRREHGQQRRRTRRPRFGWAAPMEVVVPPGVRAGDRVAFEGPNGEQLTAAVPEGVPEGETFLVELEASRPAWLDEILDALVEDRFVSILDAFIKSKCAPFLSPGTEGFTLEQTSIHQSCALCHCFQPQITQPCDIQPTPDQQRPRLPSPGMVPRSKSLS